MDSRSRSDEHLHERDQLAELEALMDAVPAFVFISRDPECREMTGNSATHGILRVSPGRNLSRSAPDHDRPDSFRPMKDGREIPPSELPMQVAARTGAPVRDFEFDVIYDDDAHRTLYGNAVPLRRSNGDVYGAVSAFLDITSRRDGEDRLRASEERARQHLAELESIYRTAPIGLCELDANLRYRRVNERLAELNGASVDAHIGRTVREVQPAVADQVEDRLRRLVETGEPVYGMVFTAKTGPRSAGSRTFVTNWVPLTDSAGSVAGISVVVQDVTEQMRTEAALRESELQYLSLFEAMEPFVLLETVGRDDASADHRVLEINRSAAELVGLPVDECVGRTLSELVPALDRFWLRTLAEVSRTGDSTEHEHHGQSGRSFRAHMYSPGEAKVAVLLHDVTERVRVERALQELTVSLEQTVNERTRLAVERTRQLQQLAVQLTEIEERERQRVAQLLHDDLQQLLAGAELHLQLARHRTGELPVLDKVGELLGEAIAKARKLSHELSPSVLHHSGLVPALRWLCRRTDEQFGLRAELSLGSVDVSEDFPAKVFVFRAVQELLFNVVKHAQTDTATVTVSERRGLLVVEVSDSGAGFDPDALVSSERSAGLGLLSLRERADAIGGSLEIRSTPGEGSVFLLSVPLGERVSASSLASGNVGEIIDGSAGASWQGPPAADDQHRIVLADDHHVIRQGMVSIISEQPNVSVVGEASDGVEALEMVRDLRPDVVIMDVSMPRLDGIQATRRIRNEFPGVRVIALSMYDDEHIERTMLEAGAEAFVRKTDSSTELLRAIYRL